jgi:hypothetical protein
MNHPKPLIRHPSRSPQLTYVPSRQAYTNFIIIHIILFHRPISLCLNHFSRPGSTPSNPPPSTPRPTNLRTPLTSRHSIRSVRITLPSNSTRRRHDREFVREHRARRQLDRLLPDRITRRIPCGRQAGSVRHVPATQFCKAADDFDGFAVVGGALDGEGHGDFGGAGCGCGSARCRCLG